MACHHWPEVTIAVGILWVKWFAALHLGWA